MIWLNGNIYAGESNSGELLGRRRVPSLVKKKKKKKVSGQGILTIN